MRKLSYFILGIIILFVLIFTITPLFIGSQIKNDISSNTAALQKNFGTSVSITNYERHWFSSDATLTIHYKLPFLFSGGCQSSPISLTLHAHVKHGPLISYALEGKKYHALAKSVLIFTSPKMNGQIITVMNWHHNIKTIFDIESLTDKTDNIFFSLKDLTGQLAYDDAAKKVNYAISLADFQHSKQLPFGNLDAMQSTHNKFTGTMTKTQGLWTGTLNSSRDSLSITRNKTAILSLKNLQTTIHSKTTDERTAYNISLEANNLAIADGQLGTLSWNASMSNAYTPALAQLQDRVQQLCAANTISLSNILAASSPLLTLMEKGITLDIQKFTLSPEKSSPLNLDASLQFIQSPEGVNVLNALKYLSAHANLSIPRELLLQQLTEFYQDDIAKHPDKANGLSANQLALKTLSSWIHHNMLLEKPNDLLEMHISIKNNSIRINGNAPRFDTHCTYRCEAHR